MTHLVVHQFNEKYFIIFKMDLQVGNKVFVSCFDPHDKNKGESMIMRFQTAFDKDDELCKKFTLSLDVSNKPGDLLGTETALRFYKE